MSKVVLAAAVVFSATMTAQVLGQGRQAVFPAQQRPPGDPALIERGKGIYVDDLRRLPRRGSPRRRDRRPEPAALAGGPQRSEGRADPADRARRARRARHAGVAAAGRRRRGGAEYIHSVVGDRAESGRAAADRSAAAGPDRRRRERRRGLLQGQVQQLPLADRRSRRASRPGSPTARRCRTAGSPGGGGVAARRPRGGGAGRAAPRRSARDHRDRDAAGRRAGRRAGRAHGQFPRSPLRLADGSQRTIRRTGDVPEGRAEGSAGRPQGAARRSSPTRTCTT